KSLGYAFGEVSGRVEVVRDAHTAKEIFELRPGPKARLGRTIVSGTSRVDPRLVARRAGLVEGDSFSADALETGRGRLYNLGVFSSVHLGYEPDPARPDVANVVYTVREGKFRELRLGGGLGMESQRTDVHLMFLYSQSNFLGGLRTLRLRLEPGYVV